MKTVMLKETEVPSLMSTYKPGPNLWLLQARQHCKGVHQTDLELLTYMDMSSKYCSFLSWGDNINSSLHIADEDV